MPASIKVQSGNVAPRLTLDVNPLLFVAHPTLKAWRYGKEVALQRDQEACFQAL